ncbi:MAG: TolC family protein [Longimicrobiaceae bacterium]
MKIALLFVALLAAPLGGARAQGPAPLAELLAEARQRNPEIQAARRMAEAAAARIPRAGALPDPMLSLGMMNLPAGTLDPRDEMMAMGTVEVGQRLPAPGTRAAREAIARAAHESAGLEAEETEREVLARLKGAYYEALFLERARDVLTRNRALLVDLAEVTRARFAVGRAPQQDVLRTQTEITRLDEQLAGLDARRTAALAELNAVLQRPPTAPLTPVYPESVLALARAAPTRAAFTAAALDAGLGDGFPSLAELQARAVQERPMLRAHESRIAESRATVALAGRERIPDVDLMLGYGARWGRMDMLSAMVSLPLPLFAARKQRQAVIEAEHLLAANELRHHQMVSEIQADVTTRYAALVRTREQTLLLSDGVIPQARATVESAVAAYQAGRVEFVSLLDAQAALFRHEIELARQLADFGRELAALELAAGVHLGWEGETPEATGSEAKNQEQGR